MGATLGMFLKSCFELGKTIYKSIQEHNKKKSSTYKEG